MRSCVTATSEWSPRLPAPADAPRAGSPAQDARRGPRSFALARLEWQRAVYLALAIGNPTYRNEMLFRVAESEASGSATVANESVKALADSERAEPVAGDQPTRAKTARRRPIRPATHAPVKGGKWQATGRFDSRERLRRRQENRSAHLEISRDGPDRPWPPPTRKQYSRGMQLAQGIENGESRAEAMLLLAEAQCRAPHVDNSGATASYQAAAEAIATVQQDGLRGVAGRLPDRQA